MSKVEQNMRPVGCGSGHATKVCIMGEEAEKTSDTCQGVSVWDERCTRRAIRYCKECGRSFCQAHFSDPDWHPCAGD
jgi:hypothetical protein